MATSSDRLQAQYAPPLSRNWTRRAYHASVVVGGWIYLHMGEVAVGTEPFANNILQPHYVPYPVNGTLSLDVSKSWTDPRTVEFQAFEKPKSGIYNFGTLWYDEQRNEVFSFGGEETYLDDDGKDNPGGPFADLSTFKLTPRDDGLGIWTQNASESTTPFTQPGITRPFGGASAQSDTMAFYLGGYTSNRTSGRTKSLTSFLPTPGLITYEFATGIWTNSSLDSTLPLGIPNGTIEWGGMEYLPNFGPNGMLVIWGGETSDKTTYTPGAEPRPMNSVALYDPVSKTWYIQQIAGPTPTSRSRFCSVSASDSRHLSTVNRTGTHEIYMYGGYGSILGPANQQYDEVWVLTLPSFTWQQLDSNHKSPRIGHTCHLVGKRQMLSIGGVDPSMTDGWKGPDYTNWNGLGVYDLSAATWSSGFNASADAYQRPVAVQSWYDSNGAYPRIWTQPSLRSLIQGDADSSASTSSAPNSRPVAGGAPASSPSSAPDSNKDRTAIIAGATIGGAIAALLPFLLLFLYIRRRQRLDGPELTELPGDMTSRKELYGSVHPQGRDQSPYSSGRSRGRSRSRSKGGYLVELDAGEAANELDRPTPTVRRREEDDYFAFPRNGGGGVSEKGLGPARRGKSPILLTPDVKEVGISTPVIPQHPAVRPPIRPLIRRTESRLPDGKGRAGLLDNQSGR